MIHTTHHYCPKHEYTKECCICLDRTPDCGYKAQSILPPTKVAEGSVENWKSLWSISSLKDLTLMQIYEIQDMYILAITAERRLAEERVNQSQQATIAECIALIPEYRKHQESCFGTGKPCVCGATKYSQDFADVRKSLREYQDSLTPTSN